MIKKYSKLTVKGNLIFTNTKINQVKDQIHLILSLDNPVKATQKIKKFII